MNRREYWKYLFAMSGHSLGVSLVLTILVPYFAFLGYSDSWISFVFALFPFVMIMGTLLAGELSEKIGRAWLIRMSFVAIIISYFLYWFGWGPGIIFARVLDALAFSFVAVLLIAKLQDQLDDEHRGRYTGISSTLETASRILGPIVAGILAEQYIGYPFLISIGIHIALIFLMRGSKYHAKDSPPINIVQSLTWFTSHTKLKAFALLGPSMHFLHVSIVVFVPLYIVKTLGLSYTEVGFAGAMFAIGNLFQFFAGEFMDRYGRRRYLILGCLLKVTCIFLIGVIQPTLTVLYILVGIYGIGSSFWNTGAWTVISQIAERAHRENQAIGTFLSISKVGQAFSFVLAGWLATMLPYQGVFIILSMIAFVGIIGAASIFFAGNLKSLLVSSA